MYNRKSPRASRYDYTAAGGYFITICTQERTHYFGKIESGNMILSDLGKTTRNCRNQIPVFHPQVSIDSFICMPNHIHGIIIIGESVGTHHMRPNHIILQQDGYNPSLQCVSESLGSIIRGFKIGISKYAKHNNISFSRQSRYHDHIIRNSGEY